LRAPVRGSAQVARQPQIDDSARQYHPATASAATRRSTPLPRGGGAKVGLQQMVFVVAALLIVLDAAQRTRRVLTAVLVCGSEWRQAQAARDGSPSPVPSPSLRRSSRYRCSRRRCSPPLRPPRLAREPGRNSVAMHAWNAFGMADLVVAVALGVTSAVNSPCRSSPLPARRSCSICHSLSCPRSSCRHG